MKQLVPPRPSRILHSALCALLFSAASSFATITTNVDYFVEYIESTGSQWIDTGVYGKSTINIVADVMVLNSKGSSCLIGERVGGTSARDKLAIWINNSYKTAINCGGLDSGWRGSSILNTRCIIANTNANLYVSGTRIHSGANQSFTSPYTMTMFFLRSGAGASSLDTGSNRPMKARVYGLQLYDSDVLVRDFKPCQVTISDTDTGTSTTRYGLWDAVNDLFYPNRSSGADFNAGAPLATSLTVEGSPYDIGEVSPAYGTLANAFTMGQTAVCTAPASLSGDGFSATCLGYELYRGTEGDWTFETSGEGNSCTFTASSVNAKLVWLWAIVADLGLTWGGEPSASCNAISLFADVSGLGFSGQPGTLKAAWGYAADNLVYTNALATISEPGTTNVTLTALQPDRTYYVRLFLEGGEGDVVETDVAAVTTTSVSESVGAPGLIQAKYASSWYLGDWDIAGADDAKRVLGAWAAHSGNNISGSMPWTSADRKTSYSTWGDNTTWGYVGYMYFSNMTYTVGGMMDDNVRLVVDGTTVLNQSGNSLSTATWTPPNGAGWYPIEIRVGNGTGGYGPYSGFNGLCWNVTGYKTKDTSSKWNKFADPGDGSLFRTGIPEIEIASVEVADNALATINLSFPQGTDAADLCVAWGAENGGNELADWEHADLVAATDDSTANYAYAVPATWGSDSNLVMRFYLDDGASVSWSSSLYWQDYSVPAISATEADGVGGDTLIVTGAVDAFPDESCTLTVYTGDSPTTMTNAWTGLSGSTLTAAGDFSLTLFEPDATSPRHLTPGAAVYAIVRATANGRTGSGPIASATLSAEPAISTFTASVTRRTVVCRVRLSDLGANPPASAALWVGETDDESTFVPAGDSVAIDVRDATWSFSHTFDDFETTYYVQVRVTNTTAGATANYEVRSDVIPVKTLDTTTYTWKNAVREGNWSDAANWSNNQSGDCLGYPQSAAASVVFSANNASTVLLTEPLSVGSLNLSAGNLWTVFAYNGTDNEEAQLTITDAFNLSGTGGNVTFSNALVWAPACTVKHGARTLTVRDGAYLCSGNAEHLLGGTLRVEDGGTYRLWEFKTGAGSSVVISNGTFRLGSQMYLGHATAGGSIRFEGKHPVLLHNNTAASFRSGLANAGVTLDFLVPSGGYDAPPLLCQPEQQFLFGDNGNSAGSSVLPVRVLADSPAARDGATITNALVAWHKGINTARVSVTSLVDVASTMLYGASATSDYAFTNAATFSGTPYSIGVIIEGDDHGDRLTVSSAPINAAADGFSPAFGDNDGYASGETVTCTAPSGLVQITEALRGSVTGGTFYTVDAQSGERTAVETFTGTSYTYTADGLWHEVVWTWDLDCLVTTRSGGSGSVSGAVSDWFGYGASATISATAGDGYAFAKWEGDLLPETVLFDNPCTFTVTGPMTNTAAFWGAVYVSTKGSDSNGGTSWADAKKTIAAAVASRDNPYVIVSNGLYAVSAAIDLTKAAVVTGLDDGCGAVVYLTKKPGSTDTTCCVFNIAHEDAVLRRIAVAGRATGTSAGYGRGICMTGGGLVDHCVITNHHVWADGRSGAGIWINNGGTLRDCVIADNISRSSAHGGGVHVSTRGLVERCIITNNTCLATGIDYYGGGIGLNGSGAVIRDSLIAGNISYGEGGGLGTRLATIENCTIAGNTAYGDGAGGLFLSATATIRNSVVWGNVNNYGDADWTVYGIHATAERCTSPTALPGDDNLSVAPAYVDAAAGDYRLGVSACVDAGIVTDGMVDRHDLDGKARILGSAPDLGCYERTPATDLECDIIASSDGGVGTAACTFEATVAGDGLVGLVYSWHVTGTLGYDYTGSGSGLSTLALDLPADIYSVSLGVTNSLGTGASAVRKNVVAVLASDTYVALDGGHVYPFVTRAHAATNLADAVDATGEGGTVHLADGFFTMPDPLAVTRGIRLVSANGPEKTAIYAKVSTTDGNYSPILRIAHTNAVVSGITISGIASNGTTRPAQYGGVQIDAAGGTLTNCIVSGHYRASRPDSVVYGALWGTGGRFLGGHVVDCVFRDNYNSGKDAGAGFYIRGGLVERCVVTNNAIGNATTQLDDSYGGGIFTSGGIVRNCLIADNFCANLGGGVRMYGGEIQNCTVVANRTGVYSSTPCISIGHDSSVVTDCIMCLNRNANGVYDDESGPGFVDAANGDYRLAAGSSAIDAGTRTADEGELDLDGVARVSGDAMDLGCYEVDQSRFTLATTYSFESEGAGDADVRFSAFALGGGELDNAQTWWTFDGTEPSASNYGAIGTDVVVPLAPGLYTVRARTVYEGATYAADRVDWFRVYPAVVYVVPTPEEAPASAAPYGSWETAATNLADAISWAGDGTTVLLSDGVHNLTNAIDIVRAIKVTSVNGPGATAVNGRKAHRPFHIENSDALLAGITITNGVSPGKFLSGGVYLKSGTVSNCVIVACTANNVYPAGLYMTGGLFVDGTITNCGVIGTAEVWGCAAYARGGLVDRCRIVGNASTSTKGRAGGIQVSGATLRNSLVAFNSSAAYAGVRTGGNAVVENCTVVGNVATAGYSATDYNAGIGASDDTDRIVNCISWNNVGPGTSERVMNSSGASARYMNCAVPVEWGAHCVTNEPCFLGRSGREFELSPNSPCRNAGTVRDWMGEGAVDLLHRPRVANKLPDIGALEVQNSPMMLFMH